MPLSKTEEQALLERIVGRSPVGKRWVALLKKEPTKAETGTEVQTNCEAKYKGYTRIETEGTTWWAAASGEAPAVIKNAKIVKFPTFEAGGSEETTTAISFAVLDAATNGNVVGFGKLTSTVIVSAGNPEASFAVETLEFTLT